MLTNSLSFYTNNYLAVAGKQVFFIGGDFTNGYELWKSDGTTAGTKMVKDIFPGNDGSSPYNLFVYKNEVYFGALTPLLLLVYGRAMEAKKEQFC